MDLILNVLKGLWESSGFATLEWQNLVMILVSFVFLFRLQGLPLLTVPSVFLPFRAITLMLHFTKLSRIYKSFLHKIKWDSENILLSESQTVVPV